LAHENWVFERYSGADVSDFQNISNCSGAGSAGFCLGPQ
jgi:hypothetical protein